MFRNALLVIAVLIWGACACLAQTAPVMTVTFDEGFNAQSAAGPVVPKLQGKPEVAAGKFGQGLRTGPKTGYLEFPTTLLKPTAGTVEMWVHPIDWESKQTDFHVFFDTRGDDGALYLYKYFEANALYMLSCNNLAGPYFSSTSPIDWKPGEWHHIAGTWSSAGIMSYVDGKPAAAGPIEALLPKTLGEYFVLGDNPWHLPRTSESVIDDVRIYDRALSPAHIAAHFAGNYDFKASLTQKGMLLQYEIDPDKSELAVRISTGGADVSDDSISANVYLLPVWNGNPPDVGPIASNLPFTGGQAQTVIKINTQKAQKYELSAIVAVKGSESRIDLTKDISIPDMTTWKDNKLGTEDKVLPPWTPVDAKTPLVVKVWDRKYDFRQEGIVNQITSGGKLLLAAPVQLKQKINGEYQVVNAVADPDVVSSPTRARLKKRLQQGNTWMDMETIVEYDGLAMFNISGKVAADVEELVLDIPVRQEMAMYRHRRIAEWNTSKVTGNLPAGEGIVDNDAFQPFYWLGNNDRGLFWMCESDENWPNGENKNAIEVIRENGRVVLRLNLLAKGQKLPENWSFSFGLQATPVKPLPENWRSLRLLPSYKGNVDIMWPTPNPDSLTYYGYPEAKDAKLMAERVKKQQAKKILTVPYLCLSFVSAASPEWPFFRKQWAMGAIDSGSADVAAYGAGFAMASPASKSYADFIVWKTTKFIDQFRVDGLYRDNTHPYGSTNLDAGCGYIRNGVLRPTYPILKYRELYRRMYSVMKSRKPHGFTQAHMSGLVTIPVLAYEDSYLDGEYFRGVVKDSYLDMIGLDTFRAEFMGRQWGLVPCFLPEFDEANAAKVEPTRGLMALLMLHDVNPWPIWCNEKEANKATKALDDFGYVKSKFVGYFDNPAPAKTDMKDVYVSAYKKSNGKTLLVVGNVGKVDRKGSVRINNSVLGRPAKSAIFWPSKKPVGMKDNTINLSVPGLGYNLVVIE